MGSIPYSPHQVSSLAHGVSKTPEIWTHWCTQMHLLQRRLQVCISVPSCKTTETMRKWSHFNSTEVKEPYLNSSCWSASWSIKIWSRSHLIRLHSLWKSNATYLFREKHFFRLHMYCSEGYRNLYSKRLIYKTGSDRGFVLIKRWLSVQLQILSVLCNLPDAAPLVWMVTEFKIFYKMPLVWGNTY